LPHFITEIPICGADLTKYMVMLLNKKHPDLLPLNTDEKRQEAYAEAVKIKEQFGRVAHDFDAELKTANDASVVPKKYRLPGSQTITVNRECLECPEILF